MVTLLTKYKEIKMKKLISFVIALIMILAIGAMVGCNDNNSAGSNNGETGLVYELVKDVENGNYYTVKKLNVSEEYSKKINDDDYEDIMIDLQIPATYGDDNLPVTKIETEAFKNQKLIKTVTIPSTIKEIGAGAFTGCVNIEKMTLPFIGEKVDAKNEKKVFGHLFGTETADGLTEAKQRYDANSETTKSYYVPTKLTHVVFSGVDGNYNLPEYAFNGCTLLEKIELNANTTIIPRMAFADCIALKTYTLPANVETISYYAFEGCTGLIKFNFNDVITTIEQNAFEGCTYLNSEVALVLPSTLTSLGEEAFKGCSSLKGIDLSKITASGFTIKANTFNNCVNLVSAKFANGQNIEALAFSKCTKLEASGVENLSNCTYVVGDATTPGSFSFDYYN